MLAVEMPAVSTRYTSRIQKGGALFEEMRELVRIWTDAPLERNKAEVIRLNPLNKATRARMEDVVNRIFVPRFVQGPIRDSWKMLAPLERLGASVAMVRPLYFWLTALAEPLIYDFCREFLTAKRARGLFLIDVTEAAEWVAAKGNNWSDNVNIKVTRALLAALRDFGALEGRVNKRLATPSLPVSSFAWIAFCLHHNGAAVRDFLIHPDWALFLLTAADVEHLLLEAHQQGLLEYYAARSDTHAALSVVSQDYQIVQPKEVLEFYRDLVDHFGYKLETSGALDGGRKVWALARTPIEDTAEEKGQDKLAAYVLLATSCDKTLATTAAFTSIRVVCQNTLSFAAQDIKTGKRPQVKVPHNLRFNADQVIDKLGLVDEAWKGFLKTVRKMASHRMRPAEASGFFEALMVQKKDKALTYKAIQEIGTINGLFRSAPGQDLSSAKETLWGAVNAVTYYADHVRSGAADRLDSAWFGAGYALKENAWAQAAAMVSVTAGGNTATESSIRK